MEGRLINKWRNCAQMCQIGGLAAYAILWLGFTDDLLLPIDTPRSHVSMLLSEKLFEGQRHNIGYLYCQNVAIILARAFFVFFFSTLFIFESIYSTKKAGWPDKKWNRWNIISITVILFAFCWNFEALRGFDLMSKIPEFSSFLREYYRRNLPSVGWYWAF